MSGDRNNELLIVWWMKLFSCWVTLPPGRRSLSRLQQPPPLHHPSCSRSRFRRWVLSRSWNWSTCLHRAVFCLVSLALWFFSSSPPALTAATSQLWRAQQLVASRSANTGSDHALETTESNCFGGERLGEGACIALKFRAWADEGSFECSGNTRANQESRVKSLYPAWSTSHPLPMFEVCFYSRSVTARVKAPLLSPLQTWVNQGPEKNSLFFFGLGCFTFFFLVKAPRLCFQKPRWSDKGRSSLQLPSVSINSSRHFPGIIRGVG